MKTKISSQAFLEGFVRTAAGFCNPPLFNPI